MNAELEQVFKKAAQENRAVLIAYLPAGFPNIEMSHKLLEVLVDNGVDLVEIGYPYSDPLMDGPIIQAAVEISLAQGTKAKDVFAAVNKVASLGAASVVMSYFSPIFKYGTKRFLADLKLANGVGVITPDLTPEEASDWLANAHEQDAAQIFLIAQSSTADRIQNIAAQTTGFIYAASLMGVTGVKSAQTDSAKELVDRIRTKTSLPIAVGLGVNTPEQVQELAEFADAVIVGSAFIKAVMDAADDAAALIAVGKLANALSAATKRI
jgi:tryptophan synthase alpha chain